MPVGVYHYPQSLPVQNVCTFSKLNSDNLYLEHILLLFWWVLCCIRIRGLCFYLALNTFVGVCICQAGGRSSIGSTCLGHKFFPLCWKRGAGCPLRGGRFPFKKILLRNSSNWQNWTNPLLKVVVVAIDSLLAKVWPWPSLCFRSTSPLPFTRTSEDRN